jgi:hypothetical protein
MARPKQMVKRSAVEIAKAKRTCKFTGATITKGTICLVVLEGPRERFCYSKETALEMVKLARERLTQIEQQLASCTPDASAS